jgi:chaperonin GroEL
VIFQEIFDQGGIYLSAGGDAMRLRACLEEGLRVILRALSGMSVFLEGKESLAQLAETICYDPHLAKLLGEIMDVVGPFGLVDVRTSRGRDLDREYVEGMYWSGGYFSRAMAGDEQASRIELNDAAILISNLEVEDPQQLLPLLQAAVQGQIQSLGIIARKLSDAAIGMVLAANKNKTGMRVIAVKTPEFTTEAVASAMTDLAILTGGRPVVKEAGDTLENVAAGDLGRARQMWADKDFFGIIGGKGDPRILRKHIAGLRAVYPEVKDPDDRKKIQERIGKLLGGSATLWIGGMTKSEMEARKEAAERTARAMRGALIDGVVPGGGAALLACRSALLARLKETVDLDQRAATTILLKGLEAPLRALAANAGCDPGHVLAEIERAGPGCVFDVRRQAVVEASQAGLYDSASTVKEAVTSAVKSAALALTVDILVHHKKPETSTEP